MKTKLLACFAGICVICAIYVTYRLDDLSSIIPLLSKKTAALDERVSRAEALSQQNSDEISTIGKFVRAQNKQSGYEPFPKFGAESNEVFKNGKRAPKTRNKKSFQDGNAVLASNTHNTTATITKAVSGDPEGDANTTFYMVLNQRISQLRKYAGDNSLDKEFAFIADMGLSSGKKRFYLIDLNKMEVLKSGLMAYTKKSDGNSAGKVYRIEKTGMEFYELYSLDKSGNVISPEPEILSPVNCVPDAESNGVSCESDGGPGISRKFFGEIQQLINNRKKPMILWMFK